MLATAYSYLGVTAIPQWDIAFVGLCFAGGLAQIVGTTMLIQAFHSRGFVVGTAYAKTESAQLVLISIFLLGARIQILAILGIFVALAGVLGLSLVGRIHLWSDIWRATLEPAARLGLGAALAFSCSSFALRAASQQLSGSTPIIIEGLFILIVTNALQTMTQGGYMVLRHRQDLWKAVRLWRRSLPVGILSALGSWGWFTGFALTEVALVRGLGQIDMALAFLVGHYVLKERIRWGEGVAVFLIVLGALLVSAAYVFPK